MNFLDTIQLGNKIDIHISQQLNRQDTKGETAKLYKSTVTDVLSDRELEISMPMDGSKIVLFQTALRIEMIVYTKRGLYRCTSLVRKRYKRDNMYFLTVELMEELKKFQRREYFRINCMVKMQYCFVPEKIAGMRTTREIFEALQDPELVDDTLEYPATILDISGGGMRFTTDQKLDSGSYVASSFRLTNERLDQKFYLVTQILESKPIEGSTDKFMVRSKFLFKDLKDREAIVHFVFEEERHMRKKEIR